MNRRELLRTLVGNDGLAPFERADAPFRLLRVAGSDAGEFLQRLCTQDVLALEPGKVRPAAFLDAKGKLLVTCLVFRKENEFWLEVMSEQAEKLEALLERYHFTEKLAIALQPVAPCSEQAWVPGSSKDDTVVVKDGAILVTLVRRGVLFRRVHGAHIEEVAVDDDGTRRPVVPRPMSAERAECLRLLAGLVRVGVETEPTTLALEADLDDHISTTKGCYTGQEIVARVHTYGHTNRKACLLLLAPGAPITAPQPLHELEDRLAVGRVMHAVPIPDRGERLGVGYLPRDFQAIGTKLALADGVSVEVIGYEPLAPLPA